MMHIPNRPALGLLALLRALAVLCCTGLLGVGIVTYLPRYAALGELLIAIGAAAGFIVFCAVVSEGIVSEHQRIDRNEALNEQKQELELERRRAELEALTVAPTPETPGPGRAWQVALMQLFRAGEAAGGFSVDKLSGVVGSDTWQALTDFYCANPTDGPVLRRVPGNVGTVWGLAAGGQPWDLDRALRMLMVDDLPTPSGPPAAVNVYVGPQRNAARSSATQKRGAAGAIVEGVARAEKG